MNTRKLLYLSKYLDIQEARLSREQLRAIFAKSKGQRGEIKAGAQINTLDNKKVAFLGTTLGVLGTAGAIAIAKKGGPANILKALKSSGLANKVFAKVNQKTGRFMASRVAKGEGQLVKKYVMQHRGKFADLLKQAESAKAGSYLAGEKGAIKKAYAQLLSRRSPSLVKKVKAIPKVVVKDKILSVQLTKGHTPEQTLVAYSRGLSKAAKPKDIVYISGPITAATKEATMGNLAKFPLAANMLKASGKQVIVDPTAVGNLVDHGWHTKWDAVDRFWAPLMQTGKMKNVHMLSGFEKSTGAMNELAGMIQSGAKVTFEQGAKPKWSSFVPDVQAKISKIGSQYKGVDFKKFFGG